MLPVISLDVIRSSVIFVQKWWPLLKEQDQEQIVKLLGKVNAYPGDFKGNEALATYVGVTGLPGQFRVGCLVSTRVASYFCYVFDQIAVNRGGLVHQLVRVWARVQDKKAEDFSRICKLSVLVAL